MTLEFDKVVVQVEKMGKALAARNLTQSERLEIALEWLFASNDLDAIHERIALVRRSNVGYRGAAPFDENIFNRYQALEPITSATVIAADGSQIYPDIHNSSTYYLTNIGVFVYHHGAERLPDQFTNPQLFYTDNYLKDREGRLVNSATVNARRTVAEIQTLAGQAWEMRDEARPLVTLYDGTLLFFVGSDVPDGHVLMNDFLGAMVHLHDAHAMLAGYLDRPMSSFVISLLHLLSLHDDEITRGRLENDGELAGLIDMQLFGKVLGPGERSAIMIQNSPRNKDYKNHGTSYEIAFFYLNVNSPYSSQLPHIIRVDIPMWVAQNKNAVAQLHALLLAQCEIQGRYPYAITRADEMAVVSQLEKMQLNEMINIELLRHQVEPEISAKLETKGHARGNRRQHRLRG